MQSHLIKMYIYHTKYLMFNLSSCAKLNELCLDFCPVSFAASTIEIGIKLRIL